jgi:hypothetical protein
MKEASPDVLTSALIAVSFHSSLRPKQQENQRLLQCLYISSTEKPLHHVYKVYTEGQI